MRLSGRHPAQQLCTAKSAALVVRLAGRTAERLAGMMADWMDVHLADGMADSTAMSLDLRSEDLRVRSLAEPSARRMAGRWALRSGGGRVAYWVGRKAVRKAGRKAGCWAASMGSTMEPNSDCLVAAWRAAHLGAHLARMWAVRLGTRKEGHLAAPKAAMLAPSSVVRKAALLEHHWVWCLDGMKAGHLAARRAVRTGLCLAGPSDPRTVAHSAEKLVPQSVLHSVAYWAVRRAADWAAHWACRSGRCWEPTPAEL